MSIFSHLQQFLKADGWLIPEMIRLELWLSSGDSLVTSDHKNPEIGRNSPSELLLDRILLDQLGAGPEPATQKLYSAHTLVDVEYWLASANAGEITENQIQHTNRAIMTFSRSGNSLGCGINSTGSLWHSGVNLFNRCGRTPGGILLRARLS